MRHYTLQPANLSCYGDYVPPSLDQPVLYVEAFPKDYCPELCRRVDAGVHYESTVHDPVTGTKVETYHRSSKGVNIDQATYDWIHRRVHDVTLFHVARHLVGGFKALRVAEAVQFLRYDESNQGRFRRHFDDAYHNANGEFIQSAPWRKFVSIALLNDDYEGGEFVLDTVRKENGDPLILKPAPGSMIIFPCDQRYPHEVLPVTRGVRRSVVTWFDLER